MSTKIQTLFSVAGKTVLVTGGGRGIGEMIVRGYVENGAIVYICSRDEKRCVELSEELNKIGPGSCTPLSSLDLVQ
jgi:NAD(P)-dependent dehydrogenase (short-subunit alcohol dehydrogenase family)